VLAVWLVRGAETNPVLNKAFSLVSLRVYKVCWETPTVMREDGKHNMVTTAISLIVSASRLVALVRSISISWARLLDSASWTMPVVLAVSVSLCFEYSNIVIYESLVEAFM